MVVMTMVIIRTARMASCAHGDDERDEVKL